MRTVTDTVIYLDGTWPTMAGPRIIVDPDSLYTIVDLGEVCIQGHYNDVREQLLEVLDGMAKVRYAQPKSVTA